MITQFWTWMYQTVNSALSTLNQIYNNATMKPFFDFFILVVATFVIVKFIIHPLTGGKGSDKAKKKDEDSK